MDGMFALKFAIFFLLDAFRGITLFLHRSIVTALALGAFQNDIFAHWIILVINNPGR